MLLSKNAIFAVPNGYPYVKAMFDIGSSVLGKNSLEC